MHCPWCCNPENISLEQEWFFDDSKCIKRKGIASELCASCKRNDGDRAITECPFSVAEPVCHDWLPFDLFLQIEKDKELFGKSGGVTFSGGEPLIQADALLPVWRCVRNTMLILHLKPRCMSERRILQRLFLMLI